MELRWDGFSHLKFPEKKYAISAIFNAFGQFFYDTHTTPSPQESRHSGSQRRARTVEHSAGMEDVYLRFSQEYDILNKRYRDELERLRTGGEVGARAVERMKELSEEMAGKAEDIRTLQEHDAHMQHELTEATRPPFIRGMEKRVKTLELFEEVCTLHIMSPYIIIYAYGPSRADSA